MTALASSLLAALPGGFAPFAGAGAAVSAGAADAFEGLLAGLLTAEAGARPGKQQPSEDALADAGLTSSEAQRQPDGALAMFAAMPGQPPLVSPEAPATADAAIEVAPEQTRATAAAAFGAGPPVRAAAMAPAALTEIGSALADQTPAASPAPADALARAWTSARPMADAVPTAPGIDAGASPAAPARRASPDQPARPALAVQLAEPAIAGRALTDQEPVTARAAPAIAAQPAVAAGAGPALAATPAAAKAAALDGETRRPTLAARGDRHAAARPGPDPTAAADRPAPVETAAGLAAVDTDDTDPALPDAAPADLAEAPEARQPVLSAEARAATVGAADATAAEASVRGSPETVAKLAADIVRKLDGQTTRFDLELAPHGLGKVDVAIEIGRDGKMTAALTFDSAQAAADLRGRSGELRLALERAGFDVSEGGLTFDLAGQGQGFGGREAAQREGGWTGRAFQRAQSGADEADASLAAIPQTPSRTRSGVDIRI